MNTKVVIYAFIIGILLIEFSMWLSQYFSYPFYLFGFIISSFVVCFFNFETLFRTYIDTFTMIAIAFIICWLFFSNEFIYNIDIIFSVCIIIICSSLGLR